MSGFVAVPVGHADEAFVVAMTVPDEFLIDRTFVCASARNVYHVSVATVVRASAETVFAKYCQMTSVVETEIW